MIFAFTAASALLGSSLSRGLASLFFGLAIGLVGIDLLTGQPRLAFGVPSLLDGIDIVVVAVGLFAVGEALHIASRKDLREVEISAVKGSLFMTKTEWARSWKPWLRGTALGFPFGVLPAGGTEIPTFFPIPLRRSSPNTRKSSAMAPLRAWRDRRRRTMRRWRACSCRC